MSDADMFESDENNTDTDENLEDSDIVPGTPPDETKKEKISKKKVSGKGKVVIDQENDFPHQIQLTKQDSFDDSKPYVYHNVEEILRYTMDCFPKNNNIHLIGVHMFCSRKGHYLRRCSDNNVSISLDFTIAESIPDENETISIFGFLEIKNSLPIFIVKFFRKEVKAVVSRYITNLLEIRKYVPRDYIVTVSNNTIK